MTDLIVQVQVPGVLGVQVGVSVEGGADLDAGDMVRACTLGIAEALLVVAANLVVPLDDQLADSIGDSLDMLDALD